MISLITIIFPVEILFKNPILVWHYIFFQNTFLLSELLFVQRRKQVRTFYLIFVLIHDTFVPIFLRMHI